MSKITREIYEASKTNEEVVLNIRLQKNGRFAGISGIVKELRVSRDGFPYVVIKKDKKSWQNVRLNNILSVKRNNKVIKK